MPLLTEQQLRSIPVSERIMLAEKIWDSIPKESNDLTLSAQQKKELDRRVSSIEKGTAQTTTWNSIRAKMRASRLCK